MPVFIPRRYLRAVPRTRAAFTPSSHEYRYASTTTELEMMPGCTEIVARPGWRWDCGRAVPILLNQRSGTVVVAVASGDGLFATATRCDSLATAPG